MLDGDDGCDSPGAIFTYDAPMGAPEGQSTAGPSSCGLSTQWLVGSPETIHSSEALGEPARGAVERRPVEPRSGRPIDAYSPPQETRIRPSWPFGRYQPVGK